MREIKFRVWDKVLKAFRPLVASMAENFGKQKKKKKRNPQKSKGKKKARK